MGNIMNSIRLIVFVVVVSVNSKNLDKPIFKIESPFKSDVTFVYNKENLFKAVDATDDFLNKIHLSKFVPFKAGVFAQHGVTIQNVQETLAFVKKTLEESPEKMADAHFLDEHFDFYRWYVRSEHEHLLHGHYGPPDYIRTTSYLIPQITGSLVKTSEYIVPLYSVPRDEQHMTPAQIEQNRSHLLRFVFTRQEIMKGIFETCSHVTLLGWVTLQGYKELVLQGSGIIAFDNGIKKHCNVIRSNEKKGEEQYFFFFIKDKDIDPKKTKFPVKPDPVPGITLAGNIEGLGLGKLFLLVSHNYYHHRMEARFGLLTDTGSAFKDNFHQLDMFAGYFEHADDFKKHILGLPHTAKLYLMIKKRA